MGLLIEFIEILKSIDRRLEVLENSRSNTMNFTGEINIYEKVIAYCGENDISVSAFEKKCGLANATVSGWRKTGGNPSVETLKKIVLATGIPAEKWME